MQTIDIFKEAIQGLEISESLNFSRLIRLKNSIPFSKELNGFLDHWIESKKDIFVFTENEDFNINDIEQTFQKHLKRFKRTNKIHIWTGESENSIFGSPEMNHKFRAWHDYTHLTNNLGYDPLSEILVGEIQKSELEKAILKKAFQKSEFKKVCIFEKMLIDCEIKGQILYHAKNNRFVTNQRNFTIEYLNSPLDAINNKTI